MIPKIPVRFVKHPDARKDYGFLWDRWLDSDTIVASTWTAESGITIEAFTPPFTATTTTTWLSGGTHGGEYEVTNTITTAAGRVEVAIISIAVYAE